jgi:hypothetical protein
MYYDTATTLEKFSFMLLERIETLEDYIMNQENDIKLLYIKLIIKDYKEKISHDPNHYGDLLLEQLKLFINFKKIELTNINQDVVFDYARKIYMNDIKNNQIIYEIISIFIRLSLSDIKNFHTFNETPELIAES